MTRFPRCSRPPRVLLGAGLLTAVLLAGASGAPAHAALVRCSSDPIVYLSNGMKVDLTATLATNRQNVERITYVLHVPAGAQVTKVVYTAGELGHKEAVTVLDDATGAYTADSDAEIYASSAAVDVEMAVLDQSGGAKGQDRAAGQSSQTLVTQVDTPASAAGTPGASPSDD